MRESKDQHFHSFYTSYSYRMDKWVKKKKAAETCGGTGMAKYIDTDEARRLTRLKSIKSSINFKHNDWQAQRIEKRRRERLRKQKEEATRKPLGDGIHVETKVSKVDAMTKCGLKLKLKYVKNKQASEGVEEGRGLEEKEAKKTISEPAILQSNSVRRDTFGPIKRVVTKASTHPAIRHPTNKQKATTKSPARINKEKKVAPPPPPRMSDDGKENTPESINSNKEYCTTIDKKGGINQTTNKTNVTSHDIHASSKPKSYFMDINSLKREHEDALKILAELGMSEDKSRDAEFSVNGNVIGEQECEFEQEENSVHTEEGSEQDIAAAVSESFLNMSHLSTSLVHRNSLDGSSYSYDDEDEDAGSGGNLTPMNGRSSTGTGSSLSPKNISRSFEYSEFFGSDDDEKEDKEIL